MNLVGLVFFHEHAHGGHAHAEGGCSHSHKKDDVKLTESILDFLDEIETIVISDE